MATLGALPLNLSGLDPGWLENQHVAVWQSLARLWRDASRARAIQAACDGAVRTGFACIREQGNWSRIRQLGLPVVLVLRADELLIIFVITMAGVQAQDLVPRLIATIASPYYFGSAENRWPEVAWPLLPKWLFPSNAQGHVSMFFSGLPAGASTPCDVACRPGIDQ